MESPSARTNPQTCLPLIFYQQVLEVEVFSATLFYFELKYFLVSPLGSVSREILGFNTQLPTFPSHLLLDLPSRPSVWATYGISVNAYCPLCRNENVM